MAFMKVFATLTVIGLLACLPAVTSAQEGPKKHGRRREALLKKFDKNGDGRLDKQERAALREFRSAHRRDGGKEGRHAKHGLRRRLLRRFDKDGDGKLNDSEREALKKFLDSHRGNGQSK